MPDSLEHPLLEAASLTLETLAYCFVERAAVSEPPSGPVDGVVSVAFDGPLRGGLVLQLSGAVLPELASNMLGLDEPASEDEQRDALAETANVICGNVLPLVAGTTAVFSLAPPRHAGSWHEALAALGTPAARGALHVERGRADLALVLGPPS